MLVCKRRSNVKTACHRLADCIKAISRLSLIHHLRLLLKLTYAALLSLNKFNNIIDEGRLVVSC